MRKILFSFIAFLMILPSLVRADEDISFFGPCWADASGKDGKGGVSILCVGDQHKFVLRPDVGKEKIDPKTLGDHPEWVIYDGEDSGNCLSFEFVSVTSATDQFWGKRWAGGGIAFNNSWSALDLSQAKYVVLYARSNDPDIDMNLAIIGTTDSSASGTVKLSDFAEGHKIGETWTRVVVPFASVPDLAKLDASQVKTIRLDLAGSYPNNKPVYVHLDKIYFTNAQLLTPVENLGWLRVSGGVEVVWDKSNDEDVEKYLVTVDGKAAGRVEGAAKRKVKLPLSVLPGTGSHIVGVAAASGKQTSSYQSVTVTAAPAASAKAQVTLSGKLGHAISPYIFGFNYMSSGSLKKAGGTLNRWGGNATTNYNWKEDADNRGSDWYFLNTSKAGPGAPEKDKQYYQFIEDTFKGGAEPILTIPIIGWVAKAPPKGGPELCSFPTSKYPGQAGSDGQGAGNGQLPGNKFVWDNDPNYNYVKSDPAFMKEWVEACVKSFGSASKGGVKFYQMDNEPGLWCWTHRDVNPKGIGYDDMVNLNAQYAEAVKSADPDSKVIGMVAWGAKELAGSAWDYMPGGEKGYQIGESGLKTEDLRWTDRKAHGNVSQFEYFLSEMAKRSKKAGKRLIDYVDDHGFPEVWGKNGKGEKINVLGDFPYDPVLTPKQFDALRIFYDPTFESPDSWCALPELKPYLWDPWAGLIPKLKKIIEKTYPGTKLAMTEYYPSSSHYYHGGLLETVNLGIFMREGMDLACDWGNAWDGNYVFLGQKLYSNYDDKGSKVGGNYVDCTSSNPDLYSFAAKDTAKTYVILVNKNHDTDLETVVTMPEAVSGYHVYTLAESMGKRLYDSGPKTATGAELKIDVPAFSALLIVAK